MNANRTGTRRALTVCVFAVVLFVRCEKPAWGQATELAGTYRGESVASDGSKAQVRLRLTTEGASLSGNLVLKAAGQEIPISLGQGQLSGERLRMVARFAGNTGVLEASVQGDAIRGRADFGAVAGGKLWFDIDVVAVAEGGAQGGNQPQRAMAVLRSIGQDSGTLAAFLDKQVASLAEPPPPPRRALEIVALSPDAAPDQNVAYAYGMNRSALARATLTAAKWPLEGGDMQLARVLAESGARLADEASKLLRIASGPSGADVETGVRKVLAGYRSNTEGVRYGWSLNCGTKCLEPSEAILAMADVATAISGRPLDAPQREALRTGLVSALSDEPAVRSVVQSRTAALLGASGFYDAVDNALRSPETLRAVIGGLSRSPALSGRSDIPSLGRDLAARAASFMQSAKASEPRIPLGMDERWVDLKPGDTMRGFRLARDGFVTHQQKTLMGKLTLGEPGSTSAAPPRLVVSPASPTGRFFFVQACDSAVPGAPCNRFFMVDLQSNEIKAAKVGRYGADTWVRWQQSEKYALVAYTEGVTSLFRFDPIAGTAEKVPLDKLCASDELPHVELNTVEIGAEGEKARAQVDIKCDFFQDPSCDSAAVKRSVSAVIDIATLSVIGPPPGKPSVTGVARGSGGPGTGAGELDLVGTWVGRVQDKDKNTFYDLTLNLSAGSGGGLEGAMTISELGCMVTLVSFEKEGEVTLFKGKQSSKFRCMLMGRMRAIPQPDGSIEWKVFTASVDKPRLHGILERRQ